MIRSSSVGCGKIYINNSVEGGMMSKRAISIPGAVILSLLLFGGNRVSAADITVGASTWYTSWDIELEDSTGTITTDRGFM